MAFTTCLFEEDAAWVVLLGPGGSAGMFRLKS
jgi:hypothetical protein